jgi:glucan phosphoethanolaminetransferase (alkaline phosphatase superfamily)
MKRKTIHAWIMVFALLTLLMLPNVIWLINGLGQRQWDAALVIPAVLLISIFSACGNRIWLACLVLLPFAIIAPLESFYVATYRHPSTAEILGTISATNPGETIGYFGWLLLPLALSLLFGLLLALFAARMSWVADLRWSNSVREWILASAIILPIMVFFVGAINDEGSFGNRLTHSADTMQIMVMPVALGYPFGIIPRALEYHEQWKTMSASLARLDSFRFHSKQHGDMGKRQVYVLVIGESSRSDHWQLFGYSRRTNPELSRVKNLVPVPNMITSWPVSIMAIPLIVTRKPITENGFAWNEASILRAMQEAGYETWWISNQLPLGKFDSPVSTYALEADHRLYLNHASWTAAGSNDEVMLQPLSKAISNGNPNENLFIVLHMMGSHLPYDLRYPSNFKQFTPTISDDNGKSGSREARYRNSYDNTVLYSDYVLDKIIGILNQSDTISALWFESDHGETLPTATCSQSGHGIGTRYDYMIPAMFWYSDAYENRFPDRIAQFRANANKPTLSASTFESLIDMAGVDFPSHDPSKSLFSPQWRYRPRLVSSLWQTDFDKAQFGKGCEIVIPSNP